MIAAPCTLIAVKEVEEVAAAAGAMTEVAARGECDVLLNYRLTNGQVHIAAGPNGQNYLGKSACLLCQGCTLATSQAFAQHWPGRIAQLRRSDTTIATFSRLNLTLTPPGP